ncbi:MAG: hypothetical protein OXN21_15715, partial [Chloroflexota bacterium]|nr:hypothetical protein [Chloroflexota bacterium]
DWVTAGGASVVSGKAPPESGVAAGVQARANAIKARATTRIARLKHDGSKGVDLICRLQRV